MKICFEGPSGVGKTTMSQMLAKEFHVIPEVNVMFKGEKNEGGYWYYQKQVERYQKSKQYNKVIFDGDLFQPIWYNWTYNYPRDYFSLEKVNGFYKMEIAQGNIYFPDLYIVFFTSIENLWKRKRADTTRQRRNFQKHLKLVETQPRYFGYMKQQFPNLVEFIRFDSLDETMFSVRKILESLNTKEKRDSLEVLETMRRWLSNNGSSGSIKQS